MLRVLQMKLVRQYQGVDYSRSELGNVFLRRNDALIRFPQVMNAAYRIQRESEWSCRQRK